ncbi:luciferase-like monooxygenase [Kribbella sp. VKM Ac-2527]|uniref:Luciferase-like monooxygenase n=1 Tax=Kribbella caucasensis TaxID=2512215 RepID=A0A4R6K6Q6_9ACTN|nr:LLM class flavin-dependent oxidoreductase [Kribbella sp. VKM Ac-2527]TDO44011.1 luciferase-like monooxygenase [Kribbella sp. VKM Ac-2527]
MRSAIWVPLFDALAEPAAVVRLAVEAEEAGWDGFFVWDHVNWRAPVRAVADPWIVMAAIVARTERLRVGPMVTPVARRRPAKLARETATLDQLSGGRLTLGVGLGSDRFGREYSALGDETDDRVRAELLDESLEILKAAWTGDPVDHQGKHFTVDGISFEPRPAQRPGVPIWVAGYTGKTRPMRRAAQYDGFFPVNLEHPDQVAEVAATIGSLRAPATTTYDIAVGLPPDADPAPYAEAGATWRLVAFGPNDLTVDEVRAVVRAGPGWDQDDVTE